MTENDETIDPHNWLWQEIARRLGAEAEREIHQEFNRRKGIYQKARVVKGRQEREERLQRMQANKQTRAEQ
jgi:hypothetical protein